MSSHTLPLRPAGVKRFAPMGVIGTGGITLIAATLASNGSNLLFNIVMSRLLGVSAYGALGSIIGVLIVFSVLATAAQLAVAQSTAKFASTDFSPIQLRWPIGAAAAIGIIILIWAALFNRVVMQFLHLRSSVSVILLGAMLCITFAATTPTGVLLGRQRYGIVGISLVAGNVGRLVIGLVMVEAGLGLTGALVAVVIGQLFGYLVVLWPLRREVRRVPTAARLRMHMGGVVLSVLALSGLSALTAVDSILARHFLSPLAAGHYVAAATAARIALFAPSAVALVVFPRFAAMRADEDREGRLLAEALFATAVLSLGTAAGLMAFTGQIVGFLFGSAYTSAVPTLRVLAVAGAALGVLALLVYYHQARSSVMAACSWLGVSAAALTISVASHGTGTEIAWVMVASTLAVLIIALTSALWRTLLFRPLGSTGAGGIAHSP